MHTFVTYGLLVVPGLFGASTLAFFVTKRFRGLEWMVVSQSVGIFVWISLVYGALMLFKSTAVVWLGGIFAALGWIMLLTRWRRGLVFLRRERKQLLVTTALALLLAFPVLGNGFRGGEGMWLFGVNEHDGLWHAALMETLFSHVPPQIPTYAGVELVGYHVLLDLFGASVVKSVGVESLPLVFQLLPLHLGWLIVASLYGLALRLYHSVHKAWVVVIFALLGGNFGYLVSLIKPTSGSWESIFWSQQVISIMTNLPFALSLASLLASLLVFMETTKTKKMNIQLLIVSLLLGSYTLGIKVYGGLLISGAYGMWLLYRLHTDRRMLPFFAGVVAISCGLLYVLPSLNRAGDAFILEPGWFVRSMMTSIDRVNAPQWELARLANHDNFLVSVFLWLGGGVVFVAGNFGTKLVGIMGIGDALKKRDKKDIHIVMTFLILAGITVPLVIIQRGTAWNTIQFMYYALVMCCFGIPAFIYKHAPRTKHLLTIVVLFAALPSTVQTLWQTAGNYSTKRQARLVQPLELDALAHLKQLPNQPVLAPNNETAFIAALSAKSTFFADPTQAGILLLDYAERQTELRRVFIECMHENQVYDLMKRENLHYLYLPKQKYPDCVDRIAAYTQFNYRFRNDLIDILEIQ